MSIFRKHLRGHNAHKRIFVIAATVLCLLLLTLLAAAQAVHTHTNPNDAYTCPLCVAMHTVVPAAMAAALIILVQVGIPAPVSKARALIRYWNPKLFTRPPPSDC